MAFRLDLKSITVQLIILVLIIGIVPVAILSYNTESSVSSNQYAQFDKSIVEKMHVNESDRVMVEKIIEMGHELNMEVVAEGVMTQEQFELLRQKGCDGAQGFFFSHALPAQELMTWLENYEEK